jgi:hypothetical protein
MLQHVTNSSLSDYYRLVWDTYVDCHRLGEKRRFDISINTKEAEVNAMHRRVRVRHSKSASWYTQLFHHIPLPFQVRHLRDEVKQAFAKAMNLGDFYDNFYIKQSTKDDLQLGRSDFILNSALEKRKEVLKYCSDRSRTRTKPRLQGRSFRFQAILLLIPQELHIFITQM